MTKEEIKSSSTKALKSIVASTNPNGKYWLEVKWAKEELDRRGVDYKDCLPST